MQPPWTLTCQRSQPGDNATLTSFATERTSFSPCALRFQHSHVHGGLISAITPLLSSLLSPFLMRYILRYLLLFPSDNLHPLNKNCLCTPHHSVDNDFFLCSTSSLNILEELFIVIVSISFPHMISSVYSLWNNVLPLDWNLPRSEIQFWYQFQYNFLCS